MCPTSFLPTDPQKDDREGEIHMRHKLYLLTLIFLFIIASAAHAAPNPHSGFRDLCWGDSHKKLGADCILIDKELDYGAVYAKRDEDLEHSGVQLQGITYSFYNDRLLNITLEIAGKSDFDKLRTLAVERFGEGSVRKTANIESRRWDNEDVFIIMDYMPQISEGQFMVTYVPILEEVVQEIEKRRNEARRIHPES